MTRLSDNEYAALAEFRHALRKLLRFSRDYLASFNLTPEQYETLLALRAAPESVTIVALSERLQVKHHTAISLVNKLADRGLLRRRQGQVDRRLVYLTLTRPGAALLEKVAAAHFVRARELRAEIRTAMKHLG